MTEEQKKEKLEQIQKERADAKKAFYNSLKGVATQKKLDYCLYFDVLFDTYQGIKPRIVLTDINGRKAQKFIIKYLSLPYKLPINFYYSGKSHLPLEIAFEVLDEAEKNDLPIFVITHEAEFLRPEQQKAIQKVFDKNVQRIIPVILKPVYKYDQLQPIHTEYFTNYEYKQ